MAHVYQNVRDTAANWTSNNPTLPQGVLAYETDTLKWKLGDGSTAWNSLGYHYDSNAVASQSYATDQAIVFAIALGG
jgi:hypothetical protein